MRVLKFGGTSIGTPARMRGLLDLIDLNNTNIVVLSAVSGTTNSLVEIAQYAIVGNKRAALDCIAKLHSFNKGFVNDLFISTNYTEVAIAFIETQFSQLKKYVEGEFGIKEEKIVLSFGELLSTWLYHNYLNSKGIDSLLLPALEYMFTNIDGEPDIELITTKLKTLLEPHKETKLFITQGYICRNYFGEIDNLRRGGSDYTASLIGAVVKAEEIQIWTDISGMHNNDPRIVKNTLPVALLSYDEAAELAYFGAKILHPQSVFPAQRYKIPLRLLNTMCPEDKGTLITNESERGKIKSIAAKDGITTIKIQSSRMLLTNVFLSRVFEICHRYKTPPNIITTSEVAVSFTIDEVRSLEQMVAELETLGIVTIEHNQTIVCIVGDFRSEPKGYAHEIFAALAHIPVRMISYGGSYYNISVVVHGRDKDDALNSLHNRLFSTNMKRQFNNLKIHKVKMGKTNKLNIGLFGFGTVGGALYQVLQHTPTLKGEIKKVVIKHPEKKRNAPLELFTTQAEDILNDDSINTIVELIDDSEAAYEIVKTALQRGKAVVSANKKMIAEHLTELLELQRIHNVPFLYESAACASIPVVRNLEEYYDNDLLHGIQGIVNGSTNYILTKIAREGLDFNTALKQAQVAGFAESDPSLDINGIDAVNKLSILLVHAYGIVSRPQELVYSGIQYLHARDSKLAQEKGYVIKLIAQARKLENGKVAAFVLPQFVSSDHLFAPVINEYNGVTIESSLAENQFFYGKGAGGIATASAVLSDLSALRYGYKYEYKKLYDQIPCELTTDFYLRVYVSFEGLAVIPQNIFEYIEEWTSTGKTIVATGILHFSKLLDTDWWQNKQTSLIVYPNGINKELACKQNELLLQEQY